MYYTQCTVYCTEVAIYFWQPLHTVCSAAILWAAEMNYDLARSLHLRNSVDGSIF